MALLLPRSNQTPLVELEVAKSRSHGYKAQAAPAPPSGKQPIQGDLNWLFAFLRVEYSRIRERLKKAREK